MTHSRLLPTAQAALLAPLGLVLGALALGSPRALGAESRAQAPPQVLPLEAEWCLEGTGGCIQLEVPRGQRQYSLGLMQRPPLGPLRGMWFRFDPPEPARFWMHQTITPLDMIFLREGKVIAIEAAAQPCPRLPCRSYGPVEPADGVVELDAGEAARLGFAVGTPAPIHWLNRRGAP
ncbi:DUF192 domain-containing protein [Synechococcus sp. RedBA-s]|uniref:DUF192 domain-containing protein n=1 Tax=Synechococcus sp. RedBA-s TaxID=2823741 RepID=UPI0020CBBFD2|nr:DUF192 domain-containing protein [Synechococcus sp. RedBA-s]MCP9801070.1 DUF192 domain-containing protein [Synechococcus sp. RedBA-s]